MKIKLLLLVFIVVAVALTACGGAGRAATLEGEWTLLMLNGASPLTGSTINITFEDGQVDGFSGCNSYGGSYTVKGNTLSFAEIAITLMACLDDGVMAQEQTYNVALSNVTQFRVEGNRLQLLDKSGATILTYARQETFTGDPAALVGTEWELLTLDGSPLDETLSFTLTFAENRYSGLAGCRHFGGDYQAGDGEIQFPSITMVEMDCPDANDAYWSKEGSFTDALSWARHWRIVNGQLEIRTLRGEMLVFAPYTPMLT